MVVLLICTLICVVVSTDIHVREVLLEFASVAGLNPEPMLVLQ
jgi:hypothetical protein